MALSLPYTTYVYLDLGFFGFYALFLIPGIILYIYYRDAELIRKRGYFLSLFQSIMAGICFLLLSLDSYHISCFPILFVNVSLLPCWIYPYFIRSYILWFRSKTSQATVYQNAVLSKENGDQELIQGSSRIASWFLSKKWTSKMPFQIVLVSIIFLLSLGLTLLMYFFDPFVWPEDIRADYSIIVQQRCNTKSSLAITIAEGVIALCGLLFSIILLWKEDDQLKFKKELKILTILGAIFFPLWILSTVIRVWPTIIRASIICQVIILIFFICTIIWPVISVYQRSRVTMKEKKECVNESQIDALELCLQHEIFYKSFEKFTMKSWCAENLYFYERTTQFLNLPATTLDKEARLIWIRFLQPGAQFEINIDSGTKERIEIRIGKNNIEQDLFEEARGSIFTLLRYSVFPLWKWSAYYQSALKESGVSGLEELAALPPTRNQNISEMQLEEVMY